MGGGGCEGRARGFVTHHLLARSLGVGAGSEKAVKDHPERFGRLEPDGEGAREHNK